MVVAQNMFKCRFLSRLLFGFVTYAFAKDAYRAIDCSMKDPIINMYDVSFGGRRAFCKSMYLDLGKDTDNILCRTEPELMTAYVTQMAIRLPNNHMRPSRRHPQ